MSLLGLFLCYNWFFVAFYWWGGCFGCTTMFVLLVVDMKQVLGWKIFVEA